MSLWLEILKTAAGGDGKRAREMLYFDMPMALRYPRKPQSPDCSYDGPVAKAVLHAISTLADPDKGIAINRVDDLIDYVVDLILKKVGRTLALVEYCVAFPEKDISEIAESFDGWDGLKRNPEERNKSVAKELRSMLAAGVVFSAEGNAIRQTASALDGSDLFGYDERGLIKRWDVRRSWEEFKKRERIDGSHICIDQKSKDEGASNESADYAVISEEALRAFPNVPLEQDRLELAQLSRKLSGSLNGILDEFHYRKEGDGYRPIAWHRLWWEVDARFRFLCLTLHLLNPECKTDDTLADYIAGAYPEVRKASRLNVFRRRTKLSEACDDLIAETVLAWTRKGEL